MPLLVGFGTHSFHLWVGIRDPRKWYQACQDAATPGIGAAADAPSIFAPSILSNASLAASRNAFMTSGRVSGRRCPVLASTSPIDVTSNRSCKSSRCPGRSLRLNQSRCRGAMIGTAPPSARRSAAIVSSDSPTRQPTTRILVLIVTGIPSGAVADVSLTLPDCSALTTSSYSVVASEPGG